MLFDCDLWFLFLFCVCYIMQTITFKNLQRGNGHSCCEYRFTKVTTHEVDSIRCDLHISQEVDEPDTLYFRVNYIMSGILQSKLPNKYCSTGPESTAASSCPVCRR